MRRLLLMLLAVSLLLVACNGGQTDTDDPDDADVDTEETEDDADDGEATADEPGDARATFVAPRDGDVVQRIFEVHMEAAGVEIVPADRPAPGEGHFHVVVDEGCVEEGELVPGPGPDAEADGYYHYGDGASEAELELEPGTYELCLQLADGEHRAFGEPDVIEITVVAGRG